MAPQHVNAVNNMLGRLARRNDEPLAEKSASASLVATKNGRIGIFAYASTTRWIATNVLPPPAGARSTATGAFRTASFIAGVVSISQTASWSARNTHERAAVDANASGRNLACLARLRTWNLALDAATRSARAFAGDAEADVRVACPDVDVCDFAAARQRLRKRPLECAVEQTHRGRAIHVTRRRTCSLSMSSPTMARRSASSSSSARSTS